MQGFKWLTFAFIMFMACPACTQNISKLIGMPGVEKYDVVDILPNDTIADIKNGYIAYADTSREPLHILYEAKLFKASGSSAIFAVSEWWQDINCDGYDTKFYTYDNTKDTAIRIHPDSILPRLPLNLFFHDEAKIIGLVGKYLPQFNRDTSHDPYSVDDVLRQFYRCRFVMERTGTDLLVKLHVCDYIDVETVDISQEDWRIVNDTKTITLSFDKKKKMFAVKK
jgi:hypothetical protein